MNKKRDQWSEIEITSDDTGELESLQLDLNAEESDGEQKAQDTRRTNFTVSKNVNEDEENKNIQARPQIRQNQTQRTVQDESTRETEVEEDTERKGRAQRRIQNLTRIKNEQEATIQRLAQENQALRSRSRDADKRQASQMRDTYKQQLEDAETQLAEAHASNDTAKVAKLTRQIADFTMRKNAYEAVSEDLENEVEERESQRQTQPQTQEVPEEAKAWIKRNPWFFENKVRHLAARQISADLANEGVYDPNDPDYWDEMDRRLRKEFNEQEPKTQQNQQVRPRRGPVSSSRNEEDGAYDFNSDPQFKRTGNRVQAIPTKSDEEMADRMGISVQDLMKEKFKYAKQGYQGYVPIDIPG